MPSSLRRFNFLQADIQTNPSFQIKRSDTLNKAAAINGTVEKRLKEILEFTISFQLFKLEYQAFTLDFIPKHGNYL